MHSPGLPGSKLICFKRFRLDDARALVKVLSAICLIVIGAFVHQPASAAQTPAAAPPLLTGNVCDSQDSIVAWYATQQSNAPISVPIDQPYKPDDLIALHDKMLSTCQDPQFNPWSYDYRVRLLKRAGIDILMSKDGGVTPHQRIEILNDYGFYLTKAQEFTDAIKVLGKVIELSPNRTVAWLNLGDAYRAMIGNPLRQDGMSGASSFADTWQEKVHDTERAIRSYQKYSSLTSHPTTESKDFLALNVLNAPSSSVCQYVVAFANAGREKEIYGHPFPVDLLGDGTKYFVYSASQGTAQYPTIFATTSPTDDAYAYGGDSDVEFSPLTDRWGGASGAEFLLFPFKGKFYVVDNEPSSIAGTLLPNQVVAPNAGRICGITQHYKSTLSINNDHKICDPFLKGKVFDKIEDDSDYDQTGAVQDADSITLPGQVPADNIAEMAGYHTDGHVGLESALNADLFNDGKPVLVDYFRIDSGAGPGCSAYGVGLYDPKANEVLRSLLSTEILKTEASTVNCDGVSTFLINFRNRVYLETDRGQSNSGEPSGEAIYEVRDNHVFTVCKIDTKITLTADR